MAWTQQDLDKLNKSIALGALEVEYDDGKVKYRNLEEMLKIKSIIEAEVKSGSGGNKSKSIRTRFYDGF